MELFDFNGPGVAFVAHQLPLAVNLVAAQAFDIAVVRVMDVEDDFPVAVHEALGFVFLLDVTVAITAYLGFGGGSGPGRAVAVFAGR